MGKFSKGARVRTLETADAGVRGKSGTIYAKSGGCCRDVIFDDFTDGHDGTADDGSNNHWFVSKSKIEVLADPARAPGFELEAGKFYSTRDGRKVGPVEPYKHKGYCSDYSWQIDGGRKIYKDDGTNYDPGDNDIVAEWVDPAKPKFKVGDRVNWTIDRKHWQNLVIVDINDNLPYAPIRAEGPLGIGAFSADQLELATPAVGDRVLVEAVVLRSLEYGRVLLASGDICYIVPTASVRPAT